MLNGVMLLWFILTGLSVLFVAVDIRATPESKVLKRGFVLLTAYTGMLMVGGMTALRYSFLVVIVVAAAGHVKLHFSSSAAHSTP